MLQRKYLGMISVKEYIKDKPLLFDGGMGTYFAEKSHMVGSSCELANLSQPEIIKEIHKEYLEAGCAAIKTNTFAANRISFQGDEELLQKTIESAWSIAQEAASSYDAYVFADIGPLPAEELSVYDEFKAVVDIFLEQGANNFLFETNGSPDGLLEIAAYIKAKNSGAFIITSFAMSPDGFSRDGYFISDIFGKLKKCDDIDAVGLNCVCGGRQMLELLRQIQPIEDTVLAIMPNAGYPVVINNRTFYEGNPEYFGEQLAQIYKEGVSIVGGCCGTTPLHIKCAKESLSGSGERIAPVKIEKQKVYSGPLQESRFWEKLIRGEKVIAVELDSPADINMNKFMRGAWELKDAGADIITIADCPIARARMDSSLLACKIKRELGMDALPHMTCRDRNLNATKALLLGLYAEGIRNVLFITGDPIPTAERDEVKSVYQFNSRKLAGFVSGLNEQSFPNPIHMFGALNVNARNFDIQLKLAKEKEEKGMVGFLTQPILTPQAFENLKAARETLKGYILGGIIPVVSEKNAKFMDSEINGISVDPKVIEMYKGKTRQEAEELAVEISKEIADHIKDYVDGYYFMTPFGRTGLISNIVKSCV